MDAFFSPLLLLAQATLFLAPGLVVAAWLHRAKKLRLFYVLPVAGLIGGLIGYGVFWIYLANPLAGQWASTLLLLVNFATLLFLLTAKFWRDTLIKPDVLVPLVLLLGVTLFYNSIFLSCQPAPGAASCYTQGLPMDNTLQQTFANNVAAGQPKELMGDWQGSDRPPLMSGVVLAQAPLTTTEFVGYNGYQLLASFLQCLWIPAIWAMGRLLKLSPKQILFVLGLCTVTGFFFLNSVFVWPKLIATSYVLLAFCLLFFEKPRKLYWGLAAAAAAASLLSHTGTAFTLLPMAALLLLPRFRPGWRTALLAGGIGLALLTPWLLYQKLYDPPGDRLAKWHIAGVIRPTEHSFNEVLADSYRHTDINTIVHNHLSNMRELLGRVPSESTLYGGGILAHTRDADSRYLLFGLGIFNLGWLALCFKTVRERIKKHLHADRLVLILGVGLLSLILWALLLFGPKGTNIYSGSYATFALLFVGLAAIITQLPRRLKQSILTLQAAYFIVVWIISVIVTHDPQKIYLLHALLGAGLCGLIFWFVSRTKSTTYAKID